MLKELFLFNNELDLLECKLKYHHRVDCFVLAESELDFNHNKKPLHYRLNEKRFFKWKHKIQHHVLDIASQRPGWESEQHSRTELGKLANVSNQDKIVLSDLDEFINARGFDIINKENQGLLSQKLFVGFMNFLHKDPWTGPTFYTGDCLVDANRQRRDVKNLQNFYNCGAHLSWMGGEENFMQKLDAMCEGASWFKSKPKSLALEHWRNGKIFPWRKEYKNKIEILNEDIIAKHIDIELISLIKEVNLWKLQN